MCIGCGLCQSVAGPDVVRVEKVESGYECPVVVGELDHETVDRIFDVCPGTRLDELPDRLVDADTKHDLIWGLDHRHHPFRPQLHAAGRITSSSHSTRLALSAGGSGSKPTSRSIVSIIRQSSFVARRIQAWTGARRATTSTQGVTPRLASAGRRFRAWGNR